MVDLYHFMAVVDVADFRGFVGHLFNKFLVHATIGFRLQLAIYGSVQRLFDLMQRGWRYIFQQPTAVLFCATGG